eukprot:scaffold647931_cov43-Prasinocladus_malaysianus.AAC.1
MTTPSWSALASKDPSGLKATTLMSTPCPESATIVSSEGPSRPSSSQTLTRWLSKKARRALDGCQDGRASMPPQREAAASSVPVRAS